MNKVKVLSIVAICLLIANIVLITSMLKHKPHGHRNEKQQIIIEKLGFAKNQVTQYQLLIANHRQSLDAQRQKIMELKNSLYASLQKDSTTIGNDSLLIELGKMQAQVEQINYKHFADIRQLCTASQLPAFEALSMELVTLFSPNSKQHGPK
jgi:periplasmic protein CpxP/Spy